MPNSGWCQRLTIEFAWDNFEQGPTSYMPINRLRIFSRDRMIGASWARRLLEMSHIRICLQPPLFDDLQQGNDGG